MECGGRRVCPSDKHALYLKLRIVVRIIEPRLEGGHILKHIVNVLNLKRETVLGRTEGDGLIRWSCQRDTRQREMATQSDVHAVKGRDRRIVVCDIRRVRHIVVVNSLSNDGVSC